MLRESLFSLLSATVGGATPSRESLALLRSYWQAGVGAHTLVFDHGRVVPRLGRLQVELDLIVTMVAYRIVETVARVPAGRLRICHGPDCAWIFADTSKSGRRCWCDMKVCGDAAKARRFNSRSH